MFDIKYPTMHKVHMHTGAIRKLLYGCAYGLSSRTYAQTIQYLTPVALCGLIRKMDEGDVLQASYYIVHMYAEYSTR